MCSLDFAMQRAYSIALDCMQWEKLTEPESDLVAGWVDGLAQKYVSDRIGGRCSLREFMEFDVDKFTRSVVRDVGRLRAWQRCSTKDSLLSRRCGKPPERNLSR